MRKGHSCLVSLLSNVTYRCTGGSQQAAHCHQPTTSKTDTRSVAHRFDAPALTTKGQEAGYRIVDTCERQKLHAAGHQHDHKHRMLVHSRFHTRVRRHATAACHVLQPVMFCHPATQSPHLPHEHEDLSRLAGHGHNLCVKTQLLEVDNKETPQQRQMQHGRNIDMGMGCQQLP